MFLPAETILTIHAYPSCASAVAAAAVAPGGNETDYGAKFIPPFSANLSTGGVRGIFPVVQQQIRGCWQPCAALLDRETGQFAEAARQVALRQSCLATERTSFLSNLAVADESCKDHIARLGQTKWQLALD